MSRPLYIMGIAQSHDASICLLRNDDLRFALALERPMRIKRAAVNPKTRPIGHSSTGWSTLPGTAWSDLIRCGLEAEKISFEDIDYFAANCPDAEAVHEERLVHTVLPHVDPAKIVPVQHPSHHLCHALAAFYPSGFAEAAALVIDCYGSVMDYERESESGFFLRRDGGHRPILAYRKKRRVAGKERPDGTWEIPDMIEGVGEVYRIITLLLGFYQTGTQYDEAGKTMGLAPYGKPFKREGGLLMRPTDDGIDCQPAAQFLRDRGLTHRVGGKWVLSVRDRETPLSAFHAALAAQVQLELELTCVELARRMQRKTGCDRLVLGGGVFLNSVANARIAREAGFKEVYVFPAATDDGTAVGAAYYALQKVAPRRIRPSREPLERAALGGYYSQEQIREALHRAGMHFEELPDEAHAAKRAAELLTAGEILGWFQGRAEFGPRALGNRSILANPTIPGIKDTLNRRVKFREEFRPYAPAVPEEVASEYFIIQRSPFMLLVCDVAPAYRERLGGITHVDGTARVQTVAKRENPIFHHLLQEIGRLQGVPVVLNTSFNVNNEPIVNSPADAIRALFATELDGVVMGRFLVRPKPPATVVVSKVRGSESREKGLSEIEQSILRSIEGTSTARDVAERVCLTMEVCAGHLRGLFRRGLVALT